MKTFSGNMQPGSQASATRWDFLTNHAHVLTCVAHDPGIRRTYALVGSLPYSGAQSAHFSFDMTLESFLEGHVRLFDRPIPASTFGAFVNWMSARGRYLTDGSKAGTAEVISLGPKGAKAAARMKRK